MVLASEERIDRESQERILDGVAAIRMLKDGTLGPRLVELAQTAAAMHIAHTREPWERKQ